MTLRCHRLIQRRHEQAAAFIMADVCGQTTQKIGVCLSTLSSGANNLTTRVLVIKLSFEFGYQYILSYIELYARRFSLFPLI